MSFISIEFAIFVFIVFAVYYLIQGRYQWIVLLLASMIFYLLCGPKYVFYLLATALSVYGAARGMDRYAGIRDEDLNAHAVSLDREEKKRKKAECKRKQKRLLLLCIALNVGILFVLKYADLGVVYFNFFRMKLTGNLNFVTQPHFLLPVGISFYTFQSVGYLLDVYYGKQKSERNFFRFLLFVSFFPQIIQGPISRFKDLKPQLFRVKKFHWMSVKSGLFLILWGVFKKLMIADRLAAYVTTSVSFREDYQGFYLLLSIFFYAFQIYCDFSGGIDVAIGVAELLGIELERNFDRPFFSKSIAEYWRRWHITLGTWFRDYIFYPLSVNKKVLSLGKWCRKHLGEAVGKRVPVYLPMIAVWMLTGMWHGSEGRFLTWGLLNCFFIILGTEFEPLSKRIMEQMHLENDMTIVKIYRVFKTFWLMSFLRVFDLVRTSKDGLKLLRDLFYGWDRFEWNEVFTTLQLPKEDLIIVLISILILGTVSFIQRKRKVRTLFLNRHPWFQYAALLSLACLVLVFGSYGLGYDIKSFIYINF